MTTNGFPLLRFLRVASNYCYLYKNPRFNDEPIHYHYSAKIKRKYKRNKALEYWGSGASFSKNKAMAKALGESLERYCLAIYSRKKLIFETTGNLKGYFLDPADVVSLSERQKKYPKNKMFKLKRGSHFWWTRGFSLTRRCPAWIPAQLVYVPYQYKKEPVIRFPISTGSALGSSLSSAILRGISEVVERDSFMIFFLNKLSAPRYNLLSNNYYSKIYSYFERYKLELYVLDITSDIELSVSMAIIVDDTNLGPRYAIGLKCTPNVHDSIIGAIEEAEHTRPWLREEIRKASQKKLRIIKRYPSRISTPLERGIFWYRGENSKDLEFLFKGRKIEIPSESRTFRKPDNEVLEKLVSKLKKLGQEVFYVETTTGRISKAGLYSVKVVIPGLQPLYLEEANPYLGGTRMYSVPYILGYKNVSKSQEDLNRTVHPFL